MDSLGVLLAAFALDLVAGDPVYPLHPTRLIGRSIGAIEKALRALKLDRLLGGVILAVITISLTLGVYWGLHAVLAQLNAWAALIFDGFVVYSCIACGDLLKHGRPIASALERDDLPAARTAVQRIVGRDANALDAHGVARAAVESIAESFLDGFLAPVFWYVVGALAAVAFGGSSASWGVAGILTYKAANTLDSMVGYRDERYMLFGRFSARLDDALNFIPARLAIVILWPAALLCRLDARAGWRIALRDRLKHESPNSAHTESFAAGALGLRLGGPLLYSDGLLEKHWLGDGSPDATAKDIRAASRLVLYAACISVIIFAVALLNIS